MNEEDKETVFLGTVEGEFFGGYWLQRWHGTWNTLSRFRFIIYLN